MPVMTPSWNVPQALFWVGRLFLAILVLGSLLAILVIVNRFSIIRNWIGPLGGIRTLKTLVLSEVCMPVPPQEDFSIKLAIKGRS